MLLYSFTIKILFISISKKQQAANSTNHITIKNEFNEINNMRE